MELSSETGSNAGWEAKPGLTEGQEEASSTASVTLFTSRLPPPKTQLWKTPHSAMQPSLSQMANETAVDFPRPQTPWS